MVKLRAYYPDTEEYLPLKEMIMDLPRKYGDKVRVEFVDFRRPRGVPGIGGMFTGIVTRHWFAGHSSYAGHWSYGSYYYKDGQCVDVDFRGDPGGRWQREDLYAVIETMIKEAE